VSENLQKEKQKKDRGQWWVGSKAPQALGKKGEGIQKTSRGGPSKSEKRRRKTEKRLVGGGEMYGDMHVSGPDTGQGGGQVKGGNQPSSCRQTDRWGANVAEAAASMVVAREKGGQKKKKI